MPKWDRNRDRMGWRGSERQSNCGISTDTSADTHCFEIGKCIQLFVTYIHKHMPHKERERERIRSVACKFVLFCHVVFMAQCIQMQRDTSEMETGKAKAKAKNQSHKYIASHSTFEQSPNQMNPSQYIIQCTHPKKKHSLSRRRSQRRSRKLHAYAHT